jgi:TonB family protein
MTSHAKWITGIIALALLITATGIRAQAADPDLVVNPRTIEFSELDYPHQARIKGTQGIVVVRVQLDDHGFVSSATSISGSGDLIPDTLENVKKWRFEVSKSKAAIIVYDFRFIDGQCAGTCRSLFLLREPNYATITSAQEPSDLAARPPVSYGGFDEGLWPAEFVDLPYPALARQARVSGIVVIEIQVDSRGKVTSAKGISGPLLLIAAARENALKWRFWPNPTKTAAIVYNFTLSTDGEQCHDPCSSFIHVRGPNFVTIIAPAGRLETQSTPAHEGLYPSVSRR